jgi:tRNA (cytidine/uridine-2'-O-)-methyltransferase
VDKHLVGDGVRHDEAEGFGGVHIHEGMLHVALWEPEIPPNTGNVARLCAAVGAKLHLIGRLGFRLDDRQLKRAGLDYWDAVEVIQHVTFAEFTAALDPERLWCVDNPAEHHYTAATFRDGDCLLFGSETKGLPESVRTEFAARLIGIPMPGGKVRSLNLATATGIVVYEALRQIHGW